MKINTSKSTKKVLNLHGCLYNITIRKSLMGRCVQNSYFIYQKYQVTKKNQHGDKKWFRKNTITQHFPFDMIISLLFYINTVKILINQKLTIKSFTELKFYCSLIKSNSTVLLVRVAKLPSRAACKSSSLGRHEPRWCGHTSHHYGVHTLWKSDADA